MALAISSSRGLMRVRKCMNPWCSGALKARFITGENSHEARGDDCFGGLHYPCLSGHDKGPDLRSGLYCEPGGEGGDPGSQWLWKNDAPQTSPRSAGPERWEREGFRSRSWKGI